MTIHPISRSELVFAEIALFTAILLQLFVGIISPGLTYGPHQLIIITEIVLAVTIGLSAGSRHLRPNTLYRSISFLFLGLISLENLVSFFLVARLLVLANQPLSGKELLAAALAIFLTNIIVFALWYWELDKPGLTGKKWSKYDKDFQFTQQDLKVDYPDWQPSFFDYLYLSLTNAINFAAADARPLTNQAKGLMGSQALISVFTLALILARSVSILH